MVQPSGWAQVMLGVGVALTCIGIGLFYNNGMRSTSAWIWSFGGLFVLAFVLMSHFDVWRRIGQSRPLLLILGVGLAGGLLCAGLAAVLIWTGAPPDEARHTLVLESDLWTAANHLPDDTLNILSLAESAPGGLLQFHGGTSEKPRTWPLLPPPPTFSVRRWRVINYGQSPVFNVSLVFKAVFIEAVRQGSGTSSGRPLFNRDISLSIGKIDPGPNLAYVFYMANPNPYYVEITPPTVATLELLGDSDSRTAMVKTTQLPLKALTPGVLPAEPKPTPERKS